MKRKLKADTTAGMVKSRADDKNEVLPLYTLKTKQEKVLFSRFTDCRAPDVWRNLDLKIIHLVIADLIRAGKYQEQLDSEGIIIETEKGRVPNPLSKEIEQLHKRIQAYVRTLGLGVQGHKAEGLNATGKKSATKTQANQKEYGLLSLLAH